MVTRDEGRAGPEQGTDASCLELLRDLAAPRKAGRQAGLFSVCSTHPVVLEAALRKAARGIPVLIETTSNQVNQLGGYTGMAPADFMRQIRARAGDLGAPLRKVVFGSDHAGPFPWRSEPADRAMDNARRLVADAVRAGYLKIHLDATMHLGGDPGDRRRALDPATAARRTADLCGAAESAYRELSRDEPGAPAPLYVIGTDVPAPGGTEAGASAPEVTRPDELRAARELCRDAFRSRGLESAWDRVIAVVVQPGVEHGEAVIHRYDRTLVRELVACRSDIPGLVYEAHATDYQSPRALREMVEDGFAILKVGPSLTGAVREALFLLDHVEEALAPLHPEMHRSRLPQALEAAMRDNPAPWTSYYRGDEAQQAFARKYALSDRCRYYWELPAVKAEQARLLSNLAGVEIPAGLLSQYFPRQFLRVMEGTFAPDARALIISQVDEVLDRYVAAVRG